MPSARQRAEPCFDQPIRTEWTTEWDRARKDPSSLNTRHILHFRSHGYEHTRPTRCEFQLRRCRRIDIIGLHCRQTIDVLQPICHHCVIKLVTEGERKRHIVFVRRSGRVAVRSKSEFVGKEGTIVQEGPVLGSNARHEVIWAVVNTPGRNDAVELDELFVLLEIEMTVDDTYGDFLLDIIFEKQGPILETRKPNHNW